jgi:hypothetical protein
MAVKVMVAPAIANGDVGKSAPRARAADGSAKPKRRRSSVYDADGNEVFITLMCLKCHKMRPLSQFGLRKMADGAIRNQPWCRPCRSAAGADKPRRRGAPAAEESLAAVASPSTETAGVQAIEADAQDARARANVAAEVAAALAGGLRR